LKAVKLGPLDSSGKDEKGAAVEGLPDDAEFMRRIFRKAKGDEGELTDMSNQGFYSVRVDAIAPSQVRPLDSIKKQVEGDWAAAEQTKMAKAEADKLAAAVKAGKSLEELAKPAGYTVRKAKPVNRGEGAGAAANSLESQLFAVKPGETTVAEVREGFAVVKVEAAKDERSEADRKKAREDFDKDLAKSFEQNILAAYTTYLRGLYPTKVEREAIEQLLGGTKQQ
ncbi:MAG: hypothetical protein KIT16_21545, partial [Rhodospirillaceae bacterium]|nr:hypothetical protein [Rhodospirillaceae bacterium]